MLPFEYLGPYRIIEPIGHGGMGTVYRAIEEKTQQSVAVKLIAPSVADDMNFRRRFHAEHDTLMRLRHENIVRLIGVGEEDDHMFYSMELVEGESLQSRIKREKRIPWMKTIDIAIQVCSALKHAHDIGVIHRDLKPANLILTENDQVKLVDFGIARIFGDQQHTMVGSTLGTADFMAPEQITSSGITVRTDLYSLGSLMYAMLTGRTTFSGKSTTEVIRSLERDRPVPLDIINPEIPNALVELVHQLLEKDPADRPPTALSVMNRMKAMRAGLQRVQRDSSEGGLTEVGPGTSATSDTNPMGIAKRHRDHQFDSSDRPTNVSDDPTLVRPLAKRDTDGGKRSTRDQGKLAANPDAAPTEVSDTRRSKTVPPAVGQGESPKKRTHFQEVDHSRPHSNLFGMNTDPAEHRRHWMSIALMCGLLLIGAVMLIRAMRPPGADRLYLTATVDGDSGARRAFLKRFPKDPRAAEVNDLVMLDQLRSTLKRLTAQAKLGLRPLLAAEEGFLAAMDGREHSPQEAAQKLRQWLDVFDNEANQGSTQIGELISLARYESERLITNDPIEITDPRVADLNKQIDAACDLNDSVEAGKRLTAMIELFRDEPWARSALERARQSLSKIQGEGASTPES